MAVKKDPTVTSASAGDGYPEGTHPARPIDEADHSATQKKYKDNPDKPDPSTVAQVEEVPADWPDGR